MFFIISKKILGSNEIKNLKMRDFNDFGGFQWSKIEKIIIIIIMAKILVFGFLMW
jgi:hypothetical protein